MSALKERRRKRKEKRIEEGRESGWFIAFDLISDILFVFGEYIFAFIGRAFRLAFKFLD